MPYGNPCSDGALPGGVSEAQYMPYCGNQCSVRLLIMVLLYFLWVWHHEYVVVVVVLPQMHSSTYGLTLMCLSYVVNSCGAMICHAPTYTVLKTHITKISELKLRCNVLSSRSDAYSIA